MKGDAIQFAGTVFDRTAILSGNCFTGNSLAGEELSVDTLTATVDGSATVPTLFQPADADGLLTARDELFGVRPYVRILVQDPTLFSYGETVLYYHDEDLVGKFYMSEVKRVGKYGYEITCTSAIGLLDNSKHYGGLYTGQPMGEVLADIVGGVVEYTLDNRFQELPVYGWLPVATRRENLHQLLFAMGGCIRKDAAGTLQITALSMDSPADLAKGRLYTGGEVEYPAPATRADITEHTYLTYENDAIATLYEGEVAADDLLTPLGANLQGFLVTFDAPMHDLTIENGEILESGVNYAVLKQASNCKLEGKAYTHTTRVISLSADQGRWASQNKSNVVEVTDATLVTMANSENVVQKVMAYYSSVKIIKTDLVVGRERPGDPVTFQDPFGDRTEGFVRSFDIAMSGKLKAAAELAAGYLPTDFGNYYQHFTVLTTNRTWTVPADCKGKIRAVLIGGGVGGSSGGRGEDGTKSSLNSYGKSGDGGAGGEPGSGGRVFIVTIQTQAGASFSARIGTGGSGGTMTSDGGSSPGVEGSATTFGGYSSANGQSSDTGYLNQMNGAKYALAGERGLDGGAGQSNTEDPETVVYQGVTYSPGGKGAGASSHGQQGAGGLGGGAAAGSNGGGGGDASAESNGGNGFAEGGAGGAGATGAAGDNATGYGAGGNGGHGGGGGGGGGMVAGKDQYTWPGAGGAGGNGGNGGRGGPGLVILYW